MWRPQSLGDQSLKLATAVAGAFSEGAEYVLVVSTGSLIRLYMHIIIQSILVVSLIRLYSAYKQSILVVTAGTLTVVRCRVPYSYNFLG